MDVQCERCKTEYEFDDALVSGRGTTVKCTNCGLQFKIRRGDARGSGSGGTLPSAEQDRWTVTTTEGRELVFTSLRELQRAILAKQVGRADTLTRGSAQPRVLGAIAELEPFFDERNASHLASAAPPAVGASRPPAPGSAASASAAPPQAVPRARTAPFPTFTPAPSAGALPQPEQKKTLIGHAVTAPPHPGPMRERMPSRPPPPPNAPRTTLRPIAGANAPPPKSEDFAPDSWVTAAPPSVDMRPRVDTIRPAMPSHSGAHNPGMPKSPFELAEDSGMRPPPTRSLPPPPPAPRFDHTPPMPMRVDSVVPPPPQREGRPSLPPPSIDPIGTESGLPPPTDPVRNSEDVAPTRRRAMSSLGESDVFEAPKPPRRIGGWIVAFVLLGAVGLGGYVVAKPYLANINKPVAGAPAPLDPRAQQFLNDGEKALTDGNLDAAKENFDKASALAETDARVLLDLARLASIRADVPWLRTRLLPPDATDDLAATKATLDELSAKAQKTAADALRAAPEDQGAIRSKIDAARIAGDRAAARALVPKIIANASQPETAYVLAALDLAEPEPLWPMVVERLHVAAAGEGSAGRARAALAYALAQSGDAGGAKQEIDRLAALARPYPLVPVLRAFAAKTPAAKVVDAGVAARPSAAGGAGGAGGGAATVDVASLPKSGGGGGGGDSRNLVAQAAAAEQAKDYDRARALYSAALSHNASDSEALAGLGDVAHATRDLTNAIGYYRRALAVNPVYLPALIGQGDALWESGDRPGAQKVYRDIEDRFPDGSYPPRVKQRGESAAPPPAITTPTSEPPAADDKGASQ